MRTEPYTPCCRHVASTPQGSRHAPSSSITTESARPGRALLRYSVVAEVEALVLGGWPAGAAVRHVAGADRVDLDGRPVRISVRTLQRLRAACYCSSLPSSVRSPPLPSFISSLESSCNRSLAIANDPPINVISGPCTIWYALSTSNFITATSTAKMPTVEMYPKPTSQSTFLRQGRFSLLGIRGVRARTGLHGQERGHRLEWFRQASMPLLPSG